MTRDRLWAGIREHGAGWRATVSRGRSRSQIQKHFPKDTDPKVMQAWRALTAAKEHVARKARASYGTFEGDAKRYLNAVKAMPTYATRERHIQEWVKEFGARQRESITATDIRTVRDRWMTTRPLGASSINLRLRALSNLYRVLDGPRAENPVRDVPELQEPQPAPRPLTYEQIAAVLATMRDSRSKRWLTVMAYTGLSSGDLAKLTRDDVDLERGLIQLPARRKGLGAPGVLAPLLPHAVAAFKAFEPEWGATVRRSVLRRVLKAAGAKVQLGWLKPYDLRHLYGSTLAQVSGDERVAQRLLRHSSLVTTARYTGRSVPSRIVAAVDLMARHLDRPIGQTSDPNSAVLGRNRPEAVTAQPMQKRRKRA